MNRRAALIVMASIGLSGCASMRQRTGWLRPRRQVLKPDATLADVVSELNRNVLGDGVRPGLSSWRSDHVRVSFGPMASLAGTLAVEYPRNFRMQVSMPIGGQVADFGSNGDEYWWWTRDQQALAVGRHDQTSDPRAPFPIPFEPEWLLDVLGVAPVSDQNVSLVRLAPKTDAVELVTEATSSDGKPITRVRRVRLSTGEVISHEIRSQTGVTIAQAHVVQHARDPETGALLPQKVCVNWPSFGVDFTLHMSGHELNPTNMTASTFARPIRKDWPVVSVTRPRVHHASERTILEPAVAEPVAKPSSIRQVAHEAPATIDAF